MRLIPSNNAKFVPEDPPQGRRMKTPQQRLGHNIRVCRLALGISQEELGNLVNLNREAIGQIELGRQTLPAECLPAIASVLQCDLLALLNGDFHPSNFLQ